MPGSKDSMAIFGFAATIASRMSWKARWERNSLEPPTRIARGGIFSAIWARMAVSGFGIDNEISNFEFQKKRERWRAPPNQGVKEKLREEPLLLQLLTI